MSMDYTIVCHVCDNFRAEAIDYLNWRGLTDTVCLKVLKPRCALGRPRPGATTVNASVIDSVPESHGGNTPTIPVYLLGSDCPHLPNPGEGAHNDSGTRNPGGCLNMVAPGPVLENLVREGAYLMSPGWLDQWVARIAEWGFRAEDLHSFVHDSMDKLCLLDTLVVPGCDGSLDDLGEALGIATMRVPVGMSYFDSFADTRFSDALGVALHADSPVRTTAVAGRDTADYAMALDLLAQLSRFQTETELIQQLLAVFTMLFAPGQMSLVRYVDGRPVGVNRVDREELIPDEETKANCLSLARVPKVVPHGRGFAIPLDFSDERIGLLFVSDFAMTDHLESYRNLMESIAPVCSLTLNNARNYEDAVSGLEFRQRLFSIISHDLRGPLGSTVSVLKMLAEEIEGSVSDASMDLLTETILAAENIVLLLHSLLEWANALSESTELRTESLDLKQVTKVVLDTLRGQAGSKHVVLRNEVSKEARLRVDPNVLQTILRNLVSNAIKFSHPGGSVRIGAELRADRLVVTVTDTGVGMDADAVTNALQFTRRRNTPGTQGEPGTGLGLLLCHDLLRKVGGRLKLRSEIGAGTTASLSFPL